MRDKNKAVRANADELDLFAGLKSERFSYPLGDRNRTR